MTTRPRPATPAARQLPAARPPGSYPPPPPGNYPPPPPGYGALGALPKEAYTPWLKRVGAWVIDSLPVFILSGIGQGLMYATGENNCVSTSGDNRLRRGMHVAARRRWD